MRKLVPIVGLALALSATAALAAPALPKGTIVVGPTYRIDPALTDLGAPRGKTFTFMLPMARSRIFRGDVIAAPDPNAPPRPPPPPGAPPPPPPFDPAQWQRQITVYIPATYRDGDAAPVTIVHDGPGPGAINILSNWFEWTSRAVDNLSGGKDPARSLPAFITIGVQAGPQRQRSYEYDTLSDRQARFIQEEVMPAVLANPEIRAAYPRLRFTDDPEGRAAIGCSSGASSALIMGWFHPEWFRRIVGYSGTFTTNQGNYAERAQYPQGAWEFHTGMKLIESAPKKPLRVFNHAAENDNGAAFSEDNGRNWVSANIRTAEALQKKGYDQRFLYSLASTHCQEPVISHTLADTLVWVWEGYPR